MSLAPSLPSRIKHQPLLITSGLAILVTAFFDLSQIASIGALLYLTMDIAVQGGVLVALRRKINARRWVPSLSIALDLIILIPFTVLKVCSDLLTVLVALAIATAIFAAQIIAVRARSTTR